MKYHGWLEVQSPTHRWFGGPHEAEFYVRFSTSNLIKDEAVLRDLADTPKLAALLRVLSLAGGPGKVQFARACSPAHVFMPSRLADVDAVLRRDFWKRVGHVGSIRVQPYRRIDLFGAKEASRSSTQRAAANRG
jgi:hypothetical protein